MEIYFGQRCVERRRLDELQNKQRMNNTHHQIFHSVESF